VRKSSQLSLSFRPPTPPPTSRTKTLPAFAFPPFLPHTYLILHDLTTGMIFDENYKPRSSSLCSFLQSAVTYSPLAPLITLSTTFSNTFSLYFSLKVTGEVSHPYKTTGKIYIYIYIYLNVYGLGQPTTRQNNLDGYLIRPWSLQACNFDQLAPFQND
jgi:hypothetical protein